MVTSDTTEQTSFALCTVHVHCTLYTSTVHYVLYSVHCWEILASLLGTICYVSPVRSCRIDRGSCVMMGLKRGACRRRKFKNSGNPAGTVLPDVVLHPPPPKFFFEYAVSLKVMSAVERDLAEIISLAGAVNHAIDRCHTTS